MRTFGTHRGNAILSCSFLTSETLFDFLLFFKIPRICNKVQTVSILSDIHRKLNYFPRFILSHIQTYYNILSPFFLLHAWLNCRLNCDKYNGFYIICFFYIFFWYLTCCAKLEFQVCIQKNGYAPPDVRSHSYWVLNANNLEEEKTKAWCKTHWE